jgi:hypothetical membrane protein
MGYTARLARIKTGQWMRSAFWQRQVFLVVFIGCGLFVLLTVIARLMYPGGLYTGELTSHYDFFRNFFSDLGRIALENGKPNTASAILFCLALSIAGVGLVFFFVAFRNFFKGSRAGNILSLLGTIAGIASGLCFVGIAFAPYDLFLLCITSLSFGRSAHS